MTSLRGSRASQSGQQRFSASITEHLLIAALIAVAIITALGTLRGNFPGVLHEPGTPEYTAARRG